MTRAAPTTPEPQPDASEELRRYRALAAWAQLATPEEYPAIVAKLAKVGR